MKTRTFSGWKARLRALCFVALCGLAMAGGALAQDTPPPSAVGTDVAVTPAEESASQPASAAVDAAVAPAPTISKPDTVWVLVSAALVIFMTLPGLALFYGGLVRSKNVLSILIQNLVVFSLVAVLWAVYGLSRIHI